MVCVHTFGQCRLVYIHRTASHVPIRLLTNSLFNDNTIATLLVRSGHNFNFSFWVFTGEKEMGQPVAYQLPIPDLDAVGPVPIYGEAREFGFFPHGSLKMCRLRRLETK